MKVRIPRYARHHNMWEIVILIYLNNISMIYMQKLHKKCLFWICTHICRLLLQCALGLSMPFCRVFDLPSAIGKWLQFAVGKRHAVGNYISLKNVLQKGNFNSFFHSQRNIIAKICNILEIDFAWECENMLKLAFGKTF